MEIHLRDLTEKELMLYNALTEKGKREIHNPFSEQGIILVCDNCRIFITCFQDRKIILPEGVSHSVLYLWSREYESFQLCLLCDNQMQEDILEVMRRYGKRRRTSLKVGARDEQPNNIFSSE